MSQPSEAIQDKVHFIFNNISANNLKAKVSGQYIFSENTSAFEI